MFKKFTDDVFDHVNFSYGWFYNYNFDPHFI